MNTKAVIAAMTGAALLGGAAAGITGIASADTNASTSATSTVQATTTQGWMHGLHLGWAKNKHGRKAPGSMMRKHDVRGTVTAVNGNTITITAKNGTSYTIDATNAKLAKIETITAAQVSVGDTLNAQGTVSGTNVTAAHILDGVLPFSANR